VVTRKTKEKPTEKKRRRYGSYFWIDPKTKLGYAKVQIPTDERTAAGKIKYKTIMKRADNVTAADQIAQEILSEHSLRGRAFLDGRKMTFQKLADWYKTEFVIAPIYSNNKKVAGMRSFESERNKIDRLCLIFGNMLIEEIDEFALRRFKLQRIKANIKPATINRDFETIRAMMRKALKQKWLKEMIDFTGLIDKSLEERRTVTVSEEDFQRILEVAKKLNYAPRLYALILALRDSGARPSELYPVNDYKTNYETDAQTFFEPIRWRDIFDEEGNIKDITRLISYKGKIVEERFCVVTERMKGAFLDLWNYLKYDRRSKNTIPTHKAELDNLIFPETSYKKSWQIVRDKTGLTDLRLRDLRRDWSSRLARHGFSDRLAQRGMGHKQMQQTFEYTEFNLAAAMQAKELLDSENAPIIVSEENN